MSSDNYYGVKTVQSRDGVRYFVYMGFMSDEEEYDWPVNTSEWVGKWFDSFEEAVRYANSEYSEYGVFIED